MRRLIGTCINSFDEDGCCVITDRLPYRTVTDFAAGDERAESVSEKNFRREVIISLDVEDLISGHAIHYLWDRAKDLYMLYDSDDDIHYFFGV